MMHRFQRLSRLGAVLAGLVLGWLGLAGLVLGGAAFAEGLTVIRKPIGQSVAIQKNTVGIITGSPKGIYARLGSDLLRLLDDRKDSGLRLAVLLGSGSVDNLDDLWNLPGVSFAMVQGDVLDAYAADATQFQWLRSHLRYVARLHTEVLHVITRKEIAGRGDQTVCALRGRRVNVGGLGSGAQITVQRLFNDILGLDVTFDPASIDEAIDRVANRQVDAFAYVVGRASPFFHDLERTKSFAPQDLTWLDLPRALLDHGCGGQRPPYQADLGIYEPAQLTATDYRGLIPPDRIVDTIGVPAVLASYMFDTRKMTPAQHERAVANETFIQKFFQFAFDRDQGLGVYDKKYDRDWCGVDLKKKVHTWDQDPVAAKWWETHVGTPTRIDCIGSPPSSDLPPFPSYCAQREDIIDAFKRQEQLKTRPLSPADPNYSRALLEFSDQQCRRQ